MSITRLHDILGSAVYALNSDIQIAGNLLFEKNEAQRGGAIALEGTSQLSLQVPVTVDFINSTAMKGRALFFADPILYCTAQSLSCFFSFNLNDPRIMLDFSSNSARNGGNVL